jgi:hypothetical protein
MSELVLALRDRTQILSVEERLLKEEPEVDEV